MKKNPYNYPYSKKEHNYKAIKILFIIFIICVIGLVICSFFTPLNFSATNSSNKGILGFIQSCAGYTLGFIF